MKITDVKKNIEKILDDNKATNIISINLENKSYIADYMIIASGTSSRHLQALSEILVSELKKIGLEMSNLIFTIGLMAPIGYLIYNGLPLDCLNYKSAIKRELS